MISNRQLFLSHLAQTSDAPLALEIVKAEGIYLYDAGGKRYTDLISGISVSNTGHRHPQIVQAIKNQADQYLHLMVYGEYIQSPQVKLAAMLSSRLPAQLDNCYFVNSGSEAVEGALKLAKRYTGRQHIVSLHNAYHGSSHGSLSVMGNTVFQEPFLPLLPGVEHITVNNTDELQIIGSHTACVIVEPVQGEAGVIRCNDDYIKQLRQRCDETGALLIFDEIQTGMGRTGTLFTFEQYGVMPDILLLAKGLGGGMPLGAFIASHEIMQTLSFNPALGHITTFGGHPVSCAAAIANIEVIENEKLVQDVAAKSDLFRQWLQHAPGVKEVRSAGLLIALQLENFTKVKKTIDRALDKGVITDWFLFNDSAMRIAPPLTITEAQINESCEVIVNALKS